FTKAAAGLESTGRLSARLDYVVWYARNAERVKYREVFTERDDPIGSVGGWVELSNGERRRLTREERADFDKIPVGARLFGDIDLTKPGPGAKYTVEFEGKEYESGKRWWGTPKDSLMRVIGQGRVIVVGNKLRFVKYADDFAFQPVGNLWHGLVGQ